MADVTSPPIYQPGPAWREDDFRPPLPFADYVRANRRRLVVAAVVSLVAAEALAAFLLIRPREYSAAATVTIPAAGSTPIDVGQTVADYRSVVKSRPVLEAVARDTDRSVGELSNGVSVSREGTSRYVKVSFRGKQRAEVPSVARAVAVAGLEELFQPAYASADRALDRAQAEMDKVRAKVAAFNASHNLVLDPPQLFRQRSTALANAQAQGNGAAIARLQKEVDDLRPVVADFRELQSEQTQVQSVLNAAASKRGEARAHLQASKSPSAVELGTAHDTTTFARLLTLGTVVFLLSLPLTFLATALWPRLAGRR